MTGGFNPFWSPDGSPMAFPTAGDGSVYASAIDADEQGEAERTDELTFPSWDSGSYSWECS